MSVGPIRVCGDSGMSGKSAAGETGCLEPGDSTGLQRRHTMKRPSGPVAGRRGVNPPDPRCGRSEEAIRASDSKVRAQAEFRDVTPPAV